MDTKEILFSLIRSELTEKEIDSEAKDSINGDTLAKLYSLSSKHDIAHIVGNALSKAGLLGNDDVSAKFNRAIYLAIYRSKRFEYEFERICKALSGAEISFVPLKGSIIKNYYPNPWLRTSCDIDVLVHEKDLEAAVSVLVSELGYETQKNKNFHDIHLNSHDGLLLELHFTINENVESLDRVLTSAWQHTTLSKEMNFKYEMSNEFLLFHIIAHLSYHFVAGGCGIRPVLDLWLLEKSLNIDSAVLNSMLSEAELLKFYESVKSLSAVWLDGSFHTDLTKKMEDYILSGGVYGSLQNKIAAQRQKGGGKFRYLLARIWLPLDMLKIQYPILNKYRWLLPACEMSRWFKKVFCGSLGKSKRELFVNSKMTEEKVNEVKDLLTQLGL